MKIEGTISIKDLIISRKNLSIKAPLLCTLMVIAQAASAESAKETYSPSANQSFPTNVYWGDTHVHSNLSLDTFLWGNNTYTADQAYRFARGEAITMRNGMVAKLHRPLDFIAIADHAEGMGIGASLWNNQPVLPDTEFSRLLQEQFKAARSNDRKWLELSVNIWFGKMGGDENYQRSVWEDVATLADKYNTPGVFTSFIGYEWTSWGVDPDVRWGNLHRVVIFKDGAEAASQVLPHSSSENNNPEDLWGFFEDYKRKTGGDVLAIPHNGNLSNGEMFALTNFNGDPINQSYAKTRSRWEPLFEVTQTKGDSEAHPILSSDDQFADFETLNDWSYERGIMDRNWDDWPQEKKDEKEYEYARSALKLGLQQQSLLGVNPFKFGMIGSTDSHTPLATADDNNYWGKQPNDEPSPERISRWYQSAAGYAGVWAQSNTRASIFEAMQRKETYATTGPRMTVRFFGGWDYDAEDALRPDFAKIGYSKGVPMGGDLTNSPKDKAPRFLIRAVKDPEGANLDRVQVIKGWHDKSGELHEKIYDVAVSDNRQGNWRGKVKAVGSTVDIEEASYTNTIGDPELAVVWTDPDFNKDELAFYYVRVLEIPTPRWTAYDVKFFGLKDIPDDVPMVTQERAYTSPIWYSPAEKAGA